MLKRDITYEDFDGDKVTETFYFNLTKTELIELEVGYKGGLKETLEKMIKSQDNKELIALTKRIILLSFGIRSDDGKRFIKSDELREEFSQTAAFDSLFMEMATTEDSIVTFIKGVVPKDFSNEIDKEISRRTNPELSAVPAVKE